MKKTILILFTMMVILFAGKSGAVYGQAETTPEVPDGIATEEDMALCLPGIYLQTPEDCLPLGSSQILTDLAKKGLTVPLKPLPAGKPDAAYVNLDQNYAKLNLQAGVQAAFYPNLDSAAAGISVGRCRSCRLRRSAGGGQRGAHCGRSSKRRRRSQLAFPQRPRPSRPPAVCLPALDGVAICSSLEARHCCVRQPAPGYGTLASTTCMENRGSPRSC